MNTDKSRRKFPGGIANKRYQYALQHRRDVSRLYQSAGEPVEIYKS
ncbi:MAG: hypothetical protein ABR577_09855 [Pyrinomonadaceae bacterium]